MMDIKWVKFEVGMYDDTKLKILDSMENRDLHHYVWTRSLVLSGKINCGGYLYITDNIPHTIKTLAIEFNRSISEVKASFKILRKLEMIEFTEEKVFKIKNWDKHQNVEGMERSKHLNNARVAKCRAKKKELNENNKEDEIINDVLEIIEEEKENKSKRTGNADIKSEKELSIDKNEDIKNSNATEDVTSNNINDKSNVTCNVDNFECNVSVMEQNKKENKTKKEIKKESKSDIETIDENSLNAVSKINDEETLSCKFSTNERKDTNAQYAANLLRHYENITGILGGLNIGLLKLAVEVHGYENVKKAINKALEVNKANMTYINGILKNWRREGYPKDDVEVKKNEFRSTRKSNTTDKNEFAGFKPKEPRKLTEAERKRLEATLI
ncbi:phage replisome organizer [Clostridium beijerinckii]|nr:phage replisome organizer [Clostridium beijerinckii]